MPISDTNTEEACQIAVSQAMKHMRPDSETEILNAEDHFATEATHSESAEPAIVASVASRVEGGLGSIPMQSQGGIPPKKGGLKTTIMNPEAIERDKLNYMYMSGNQHIPGVCQCPDCVRQHDALMAWAMDTARNQHAQAIAQATQQAEEAQRTGNGPKPMMLTPYRHNWIIAGTADEELEKRIFDWEGVKNDLTELWEGRKPVSSSCCNLSSPTADACRLM